MVEIVKHEQIVDLQWTIEDNVSKYVDEWVMEQVEKLVDEKLADIRDERQNLIDEIKEELVYEMYKMKKELEDQIQMQPKVKSFWKWWE